MTEGMGGEMGSDRSRFGKKGGRHGERPGSREEKRGSIGEKMVGEGEKRVRYGEKRGDRCLGINSHWTSAARAPPIEQVDTFSPYDNRPIIVITMAWFPFMATIIMSRQA